MIPTECSQRDKKYNYPQNYKTQNITDVHEQSNIRVPCVFGPMKFMITLETPRAKQDIILAGLINQVQIAT